MNVIKGFLRYADYAFDTKSFTTGFDVGEISQDAVRAAKLIRGRDREPAIILHGVTKRSGTGYVGHLLWLHPDLYQYPKQIWEVPFLALADDVKRTQKHFFRIYEQNMGKIGDNDFLPIFGSAFVGYLYSMVPPHQRMLLKMPGVQYLNYFFSMFPHEQLLVLMRDGRDVVSSTVKTWPQIRFSHACRRWDRSAAMVLAFHEQYAGKGGYWIVKYEDVLRDPVAFATEACKRYDLDESRYPYDEIGSIPVHGSSAFKKDGSVSGWVSKPKDFNPVGRWKQWPAGKKRTFKRIAGQTLMELGYCEDLDW